MTDEEKHLEITEAMRDPGVRVAVEAHGVVMPRPSDWMSADPFRRSVMDAFVSWYVHTPGIRRMFLEKEMSKAAVDGAVAEEFWNTLDAAGRRKVGSVVPAC